MPRIASKGTARQLGWGLSLLAAVAVLAVVGMLAVVAMLAASPVRAQVVRPLPDAAARADIEEHLDSTLPLDLEFTAEDGRVVKLRDYFTQSRPVLLTLNYYSCPMLCTLQLNGLVDALKQLDWTPGQEFQIVTASINPFETPDLARAKQGNYLQSYGRPEATDGWHFLVGTQPSITALAEAVGFKYEYDPETKQYAHAAVAYVITPEGKISRYLYGVVFEPKTVRYSLVEASAGHIGTTIDRLVLLCFHYDETRGRYAPAAINIMRLGGGLTVLILGGWMLAQWTREQRRRRALTAAAHV